MKKKALILFLATITATALLFSGCGKKETETTPVAEEAIEETEATEPEEVEPEEIEVVEEIEENDELTVQTLESYFWKELDMDTFMNFYEDAMELYNEVAEIIKAKELNEESITRVLQDAEINLDKVTQEMDNDYFQYNFEKHKLSIISAYSNLQNIKNFINGKIDKDILTHEEIEELKANATDKYMVKHLEIYEAVLNTGSYIEYDDDPQGWYTLYTRVVGKPDGSWRRMTDEEAEAIIAKFGDYNALELQEKGYNPFIVSEAEAELEGNNWYSLEPNEGTIYFDYYVYQKERQLPAWEEKQAEMKEIESSKAATLEERPNFEEELKGNFGY